MTKLLRWKTSKQLKSTNRYRTSIRETRALHLSRIEPEKINLNFFSFNKFLWFNTSQNHPFARNGLFSLSALANRDLGVFANIFSPENSRFFFERGKNFQVRYFSRVNQNRLNDHETCELLTLLKISDLVTLLGIRNIDFHFSS